jgi:hypothetical protein
VRDLVASLHRRLSAKAGRREVLGLEIAMHDPACVGFTEGLASLEEQIARFVDRQRAALSEDLRGGGTTKVLHHDERRAVRKRAHLEDADDVLALDGGRGAGLAEEARDRASRTALCGARNLIATGRPSEVSTAPRTTPMPPVPTTPSIRYLPQTTSPGRGSSAPHDSGLLRDDVSIAGMERNKRCLARNSAFS